mmetsp:Transcript_9346/g.13836  ORF Transcript_9346/g.13836 Transcript_9346/m.13836 type:complete len:172 (+) Transcript_9346:62-577(+)
MKRRKSIIKNKPRYSIASIKTNPSTGRRRKSKNPKQILHQRIVDTYRSLNPKEKKDLKQSFKMLDLNRDGEIDYNELKTAFSELMNENLSDDECRVLFSRVDIDGGGSIDFEEYVYLMAQPTNDEFSVAARAFKLKTSEGNVNFLNKHFQHTGNSSTPNTPPSFNQEFSGW